MAQRTRKRKEETKQAILVSNKWIGENTTNQALLLGPGESDYINNMDIFSGEDGDYLQSRKGSRYLQKTSSPTKYGATEMVNEITWDIGSEEYLITQAGTGMLSQALGTVTNPVSIALEIGGAFALGSVSRADLFISGDKLYVLHPSGNFVIRWTGTVFVAYSMGLAYPWISTVTSANAGVISGSYTLGIEKVYRVSSVDMMASTPNRRIPTSRILAVTGTIASKKIKAVIQATELDNDTLWTHLRFWRSKNKNDDITDIINPIDAQGLDDELYEEALITKAEIEAVALASIATGSTLPLGNVGTQAGKPAGVYTIEVNNLDTVLFNLIGIDRVELLPIPACTTGCFSGNRIFFSGIQDATLDDASKSNIWYSDYAGTKYSFQYNPLNFIDTGRDGQNMMKLIAFEKDVIGIKEAKTGRIPSSNVEIPWQILDDKIGIRHISFASFVPKIGIIAITSDNADIRIFGYDLRWSQFFNGVDISNPISTVTKSMVSTVLTTSATLSIAYVNGKVFMTIGNGTVYVLHAKEKRGWTRYSLYQATSFLIFPFASGSRIAMVSKSSHLVECEISGLNTDVYASDDSINQIIVQFDTPVFKSSGARDIIEHEFLSIVGRFPTGNVPVQAYNNDEEWPNIAGGTAYNLTPNATITSAYEGLTHREYRLYIQPATIGTLKWVPLAGNYIMYFFATTAPCKVITIQLHCIIDENGMGYGAFDPYNKFPTTNTDPTWAQ